MSKVFGYGKYKGDGCCVMLNLDEQCQCLYLDIHEFLSWFYLKPMKYFNWCFQRFRSWDYKLVSFDGEIYAL